MATARFESVKRHIQAPPFHGIDTGNRGEGEMVGFLDVRGDSVETKVTNELWNPRAQVRGSISRIEQDRAAPNAPSSTRLPVLLGLLKLVARLKMQAAKGGQECAGLR